MAIQIAILISEPSLADSASDWLLSNVNLSVVVATAASLTVVGSALT